MHRGKDYCYWGIPAVPTRAGVGAGKSLWLPYLFTFPVASFPPCCSLTICYFTPVFILRVFFEAGKIRNLHLHVHLEGFKSSSELGPSLLLEIKDETDETMHEISSKINVFFLPLLYVTNSLFIMLQNTLFSKKLSRSLPMVFHDPREVSPLSPQVSPDIADEFFCVGIPVSA